MLTRLQQDRYSASLPYTLTLSQDGVLITDFDATLNIGWWFIDNETQDIEWEIESFEFEKIARVGIGGRYGIATQVTPRSNIALWTVLMNIVNDKREKEDIHSDLVAMLLDDGDLKHVKEYV